MIPNDAVAILDPREPVFRPVRHSSGGQFNQVLKAARTVPRHGYEYMTTYAERDGSADIVSG